MTDAIELTSECVLHPIPTNAKREWRVFINGEPVGNVQTFEICNPRYESAFYGLDTNNQGSVDRLLYRQAHPTILIVPFAYLGSELWVGLRRANIETLGGTTDCMISGTMNIESPIAAAKRILLEQTGISTDLFNTVTQLEGRSINANHTLFITAPERGDQVWALELGAHCFEKTGETWQLTAGVAKPSAPSLHWCRWTEAVQKSPDGLGLAAISRLLAHLKEQGRPL